MRLWCRNSPGWSVKATVLVQNSLRSQMSTSRSSPSGNSPPVRLVLFDVFGKTPHHPRDLKQLIFLVWQILYVLLDYLFTSSEPCPTAEIDLASYSGIEVFRRSSIGWDNHPSFDGRMCPPGVQTRSAGLEDGETAAQ